MCSITGDGVTPDLDLAFASGSLHELRAEVLAQACGAGLSESRAMDVVLAVHELAANSVCHGAGTGRLRMWQLTRTLCCLVDDGDPPASGDSAGRPGGRIGPAVSETGASRPTPTSSWPSVRGHGLWVVQHVADHMHVVSGPGGTRVRLTFDLPLVMPLPGRRGVPAGSRHRASSGSRGR
jgi:anti-sigma regulatory factor (Ser/Thr protein kinase)